MFQVPRSCPKGWALSLALLGLAPQVGAQVVPRSAGKLLRRAPAGWRPLAPPRGLAGLGGAGAALTKPGLLAPRPPVQAAPRNPAGGWPAASCRSLAVQAGPAGDGSGFKPVAADDPRIRKAMEELLRDGRILFEGSNLDVQQAWIREAPGGRSVRLRLLMEMAGDGPAEAARAQLEVSQDPGQAWSLLAVAAAPPPAAAPRALEQPTLQVMIPCPETDEAVPTGLAMTSAEFLAVDMEGKTLEKCPACSGTHGWSKVDAHLQ